MRSTRRTPTIAAAGLWLVIWLSWCPIHAFAQQATAPSLQDKVTRDGAASALDTAVLKQAQPSRVRSPKLKTGTAPRRPVSMDLFRNFIEQHRASSQKAAAKISADQRRGIRGLNRPDSGGGPSARVIFNRGNGTPRMIKIEHEPAAGRSMRQGDMASTRQAADAFLAANRGLLKLQDPLSEFTLKKEWTDRLGKRHIRYQQAYQGIPVWAREAVVHTDAANGVYMFQGQYEPTPAVPDFNPAISRDDALAAAYAHLGTQPSTTGAATAVDPVWYVGPHGRLIPAYKLELRPNLTQRWVYFVDVNTGDVIHRIDYMKYEVMTAQAEDLTGATRTFNVWRRPDNGVDYIVDPTIPLADPPYNPVPALSEFGNSYILNMNHEMDRPDALTFFRGPDWDPAGVSGAYNISRVHEYYVNTFGRAGIDNNAAQPMNYLLITHYGQNYANASWNGSVLIFGDGDDTLFSSLIGALDVVAHEYAHGVTEYAANFVYENQSGALDEAFSDIFACMVDRDDWTMGEDITLQAPFVMRDLANPANALRSLPAKMSEYRNMPNDKENDNGGVHINCSIPARAAYLIADGLTAEGLGTSIGRDKTEQIFYRALTLYLTQSSQFVDAREATIQAAQDLYGAAEAGAVQAAWDVVEVHSNGGGAPPDQTPSPTDVITGEDRMVYLRPADGRHDRWDEHFDLYVQTIPSPFPGYDAATDVGPLNSVAVKYTRPSAVTLDGETAYFFVGTDHNVYAVLPDGTETALSDSGNIHSFTITPDGKYLAYTSTSADDNTIYVGDLQTGVVSQHQLQSPSTSPEDSDGGLNTILYADALSIDYSGSTLVFDALNKLSFSQNQEEYLFWTIGFLNIKTGQQTYPFPTQNPVFDIGNSCFAYNNSYVVVMDIFDHSTTPVATTEVYTFNLETQTGTLVMSSNPDMVDFGFNPGVFGIPSFWGDDKAVTMQIFDADGGGMAYKVPLDENWGGDPSAMIALNDNGAAYPVMHRAGDRQLMAGLDSSAAAVNFIDGKDRQQIALTNSGNRDINIYRIEIVGPGSESFRHDGVNGLLGRGKQMTISIFFEPAAQTTGTQSANLIIESDADAPRHELSLTGTVGAGGTAGPAGGDGNGGGGGGGGGCFIQCGRN